MLKFAWGLQPEQVGLYCKKLVASFGNPPDGASWAFLLWDLDARAITISALSVRNCGSL